MKTLLTLIVVALSLSLARPAYDQQWLNAQNRRLEGSHKLRNQQHSFVSEHVDEAVLMEYSSCQNAYRDVIRWAIVLYGDWVGNKGGNSLLYYLNHLLSSKVPRMVQICLATTNISY